jgi:hypothetical protein
MLGSLGQMHSKEEIYSEAEKGAICARCPGNIADTERGECECKIVL